MATRCLAAMLALVLSMGPLLAGAGEGQVAAPEQRLTIAAEGERPVLDISNRRQVFVDRSFLATATNVALRVHPPRKTGDQTVAADRPWERGGLGPYSCVLKDGSGYRMWYHAMDAKLWDSSPTAGAICYATSADGITWAKPDLGIVEYEGRLQNNIVVGHGAAGLRIGQDGMMVFEDPNAPVAERLRMVNRFAAQAGNDERRLQILSSGDGIHWKLTHTNVMTYRPQSKGHHLDSQNVIFWDASRRKYVAYVRRNLNEGGSQGRAIARAESERLDAFPVVQDCPVVFPPEPPDPAHGGVSVVDFYNSGALCYPWADNAYYLFPQAYYHYTRALREFAQGLPANAGPLETRFAASRDGVHWNRFEEQPFISLGVKGEFDCHSARLIYGLVPDLAGREMYMYYRGSDWLHGWDRDERNRQLLTVAGLGATQNVTLISRVVLRRDGFVSVSAANQDGEFTTPLLRFAGRRLQININTSATGRARVACLDAEGRIIPGYSLADCDLIHTANEINRTVTWKGREEVGPLAGQIVRLRFALRGAELYAFQFQ